MFHIVLAASAHRFLTYVHISIDLCSYSTAETTTTALLLLAYSCHCYAYSFQHIYACFITAFTVEVPKDLDYVRIMWKYHKNGTYNKTCRAFASILLQLKSNNAFCVCTVELHVTAKNIKILNFSRQYFYGQFRSPAANKHTYVFTQSTRYFLLILIKFGFSRQIFMNVFNAKFRQNPSSGIRDDIGGQAEWWLDEHGETNRSFPRLCEKA